MPQGEGMDYLRFLAVSRSQEEGRWPSEVPGEGESQKPTGVLSWNGNWCEESGIGDPATLISKNVLGKSPELSENLDAEGQWRCLSFTCPVPWFRFPLVPTQGFHSTPAVCQALGTQWRTRWMSLLFLSASQDTECCDKGKPEVPWSSSNPAGEVKEGFSEEVVSKRVGAVLYRSSDSCL